MISILFVTHKKNAFATLIAGLEKKTSLKIAYTQSGLKALDMMKENVFDLVVADQEISDMTGLAFAKKLVKVNPMINCSVVSSLPAEDFHEVSEGFGILMQLPVNPDETAGEALFERLSEVLAITQSKPTQ